MLGQYLTIIHATFWHWIRCGTLSYDFISANGNTEQVLVSVSVFGFILFNNHPKYDNR